MKEVQLNVQGITCSGCADSIYNAMAAIGASANVDLATATVIVRYEEQSLEMIIEAIEEQFRRKGKTIKISVLGAALQDNVPAKIE